MDMPSIISWTWDAIACGAGDAVSKTAYEAVKTALGGFFPAVSRQCEQNQRAEFEALLHTLLESNAQMRGQLAELAQGNTGNTGNQNITTGDIYGDGNFNNGSFIKN